MTNTEFVCQFAGKLCNNCRLFKLKDTVLFEIGNNKTVKYEDFINWAKTNLCLDMFNDLKYMGLEDGWIIKEAQ